jgi:hypothetical protein
MSVAFTAATLSEQPAFNRWTLPCYDWLLEFTCDQIWQCPTKRTLSLYASHLSANHLEVGVGSGYFLDRSCFPAPVPQLALLDINHHCLRHTASRLARYAPIVFQANALMPLALDSRQFDSIAINYVLHCMPGDMTSKGVAFENLRPYLRDGGVLFGSTVLRQGLPCSLRARAALRLYNGSRVFCNMTDSLSDLSAALNNNFREVRIEVIGCVAQFSARA